MVRSVAICRAVSVTTEVQVWLREARHIRVLNCFEHAWNFADENHRVVSVVTPAIGAGPLNIVVPITKLPLLSEPDSIGSTPVSLKTPWLTIHIESAPVWDAILPIPEPEQFSEMILVGRELLHGAVDSLAQPYLGLTGPIGAFQQMTLQRLFQAIQHVILALEIGDDLALIAATWSLSGKGIGLTPAGDDWLLGCMVALHCLSEHEKAMVIAQAALPHTTVFSAAHLRMAGRCKFSRHWHHLMNAESSTQMRSAMMRLLRYGATSGADALTGFVQVLEAFGSGTGGAWHDPLT